VAVEVVQVDQIGTRERRRLAELDGGRQSETEEPLTHVTKRYVTLPVTAGSRTDASLRRLAAPSAHPQRDVMAAATDPIQEHPCDVLGASGVIRAVQQTDT